MRKSYALLPIIPAVVFFVVAFRPAREEFGKVTLPLGTVEVQRTGSSDWARAKVREPVFVNERIRTKARSRAEITLKGGGKIRIGENSELELIEANVKPMQKKFDANLSRGKIWVSAKAAFGEKKNVSVRTPTAVAAIRGTKYRANAGEEESSVLVYEGKVDVNTPQNLEKMRKEEPEKKQEEGAPKFKLGPVQKAEAPTQVAGPYEVTLEEWITLVEGMQINLRKDGKYHMFEFDKEADSQLDWVKWNKERDEQ